MTSDAPQEQPPSDDDANRRGPPEDATPLPPDGSDSAGTSGPDSVDPLSGIFGLDPVHPGHDPLIGMVIGGVRLVRVIGQGGMGKVYEGEQQKPRFTVAVKVMRPGLATPEMRRRFEYEAEILARLRHPGIAQIFSAGVESVLGVPVPYFVMEYIPEARTLTDYAEGLKLPTRARLDLFRSVCEAVAHGHRKGVVHRDLKPANILVDATGQPKVIDFGVAKATDSDLALTTMQTDVGQLIGTLQYMGPEQIDGDPNEIDTRCDVYALGVVLYELLTGRLPYDVQKKAVLEVMRIVKEEEPTPISAFDRTLRRDVAVIAGKCLEKDRARRYSSASELGADVARHLAGEPIQAKRQSFVEGVLRLARKHRAAALATGGVFAALVLAVCGITYFYLRAEDQRTVAVANEAAAKTERDRARKVLDFLQEAFGAPDPTKIGREVTVADVLIRLSRTTADRFQGDPITEAEVLATIGETLESLGLFSDAERPTSQAVSLTESSDAVSRPGVAQLRAKSLSTLARIRLFEERLPETVELYREVISLAEREMTEEPLFRVRNLNGLALAYLRHGRYQEAAWSLDNADELIRVHGHGDTLEAIESCQYRAMALGLRDRLRTGDESRRLIEDALEKSRHLLGPEHRKTAELLSDVAVAYRHAGRYEEAQRLLAEALAIDEKVLGRDHWDVAKVLNNLAVLYRNMGRLDDAEQAAQRCLAIQERQFGPSYRGCRHALANLGMVKVYHHKPEEAESLFRKAIALTQQNNPCDPQVSRIQDNMFPILAARGDVAGMARDLADAWSLAVISCGHADPEAVLHLDRLYYLAWLSRKPELAVAPLREAATAANDAHGMTRDDRAVRQAQLAHLLCLVPSPAESEALARDAFDTLRRSRGWAPETLDAGCTLADALLLLGRWDEAAAILGELLDASTTHTVTNAWSTLRLRRLVAERADLQEGHAEATALYEDALARVRATLGITSGFVFGFVDPSQFGELQNLAVAEMNQLRDRLSTIHADAGAVLVQSARLLMNERRYGQAEAVLRQAASIPDAEQSGATTTLKELLQILGRSEKN